MPIEETGGELIEFEVGSASGAPTGRMSATRKWAGLDARTLSAAITGTYINIRLSPASVSGTNIGRAEAEALWEILDQYLAMTDGAPDAS